MLQPFKYTNYNLNVYLFSMLEENWYNKETKFQKL